MASSGLLLTMTCRKRISLASGSQETGEVKREPERAKKQLAKKWQALITNNNIDPERSTDNFNPGFRRLLLIRAKAGPWGIEQFCHATARDPQHYLKPCLKPPTLAYLTQALMHALNTKSQTQVSLRDVGVDLTVGSYELGWGFCYGFMVWGG